MGQWIETSKELVLNSFLFRFCHVGYRSLTSGKEGKFIRLESKDWANVIPLTPRGEVVMVRQFRYGIGEITLEFPAGQVEPGESPLAAIERELREETGSSQAEIRELGWCHPNPAFLNNRCHHYLAVGVELGGAQALDEHEEIELVTVPLAEIDALIARGEITHSLSLAAWYLYQARVQSLSSAPTAG